MVELLVESTLCLVAIENIGPVTEERNEIARIVVPPVFACGDLFKTGRNVASFGGREKRRLFPAGGHHAFPFEGGSHAVVRLFYPPLRE
jgi:hypothetical protein